MVLSKKSKAYFIDINEHTTFVARANSFSSPLEVEEIKTCPTGNADALETMLKDLQPKRSPSGYVHGHCGVYSENRLVRRATLDPKRFKEPTYLNEVVSSQFRVEPDKYALAALNATTGLDLDLGDTNQKEALFAGMPSDEISSLQKQLLSRGIYPERLEIGTVATLGALLDYMNFSKAQAPTLVLEVGKNSTQSFILSETGVDASRPIAQGLDGMVPIVQKELGLKDEESARKLFYSNTFDFTSMGGVLIKKLLKELQSSIGFYEVQTGQSIGQVICTLLPPKLGWLESAIATQLGVTLLKIDYSAWLNARGVALGSTASQVGDTGMLGLAGLMISHAHAANSEKKS